MGFMQISLVLPAKNEAQGLRRTLPGVRELLPGAQIIVEDDGSNDETAQDAR
jgi:glycosyltransferase involved in cell wall biosynthesis